MSRFVRTSSGKAGPAAPSTDHARYLRACGIDRALERLNGPYGVRRYLLVFLKRGDQVVVTDLETVPLAWGGGPPPDDVDGTAMVEVERALTRLHRNMALGPAWERGVLGVLRDRFGQTQLFPAFDVDADEAMLEDLPVPPKPGHPLETPAWLEELARYGPEMGRIQARSAAQHADRDNWAIEDGFLRFDDGRSVRCRPLATFSPTSRRFEWQVDKPLFDGDVYEWPDFVASLDAAMEVGLVSCARLGASWLFVGRIEDDGGVLLVAVLG